jgi:hypothetical protein
MDWYLSEHEANRRHSELLQEAETNRLMRTPRSVGGSRNGSRSRAMHWLGSRLVESGRRLQML